MGGHAATACLPVVDSPGAARREFSNQLLPGTRGGQKRITLPGSCSHPLRKEIIVKVITTVTTTIYFTNNIVIHRQISLARAVTLMVHTNAIIPPDTDLLEVRSPTTVMLIPAEIIFSVDKAFIPHVPTPTRGGIYRRDRGVCAYCGRMIPLAEASMDHIIPHSLGGPATWDNLVNACRRCNGKKANRTPEQAGMPLRFKPFTPKVRLRVE